MKISILKKLKNEIKNNTPIYIRGWEFCKYSSMMAPDGAYMLHNDNKRVVAILRDDLSCTFLSVNDMLIGESIRGLFADKYIATI